MLLPCKGKYTQSHARLLSSWTFCCFQVKINHFPSLKCTVCVCVCLNIKPCLGASFQSLIGKCNWAIAPFRRWSLKEKDCEMCSNNIIIIKDRCALVIDSRRSYSIIIPGPRMNRRERQRESDHHYRSDLFECRLDHYLMRIYPRAHKLIELSLSHHRWQGRNLLTITHTHTHIPNTFTKDNSDSIKVCNDKQGSERPT